MNPNDMMDQWLSDAAFQQEIVEISFRKRITLHGLAGQADSTGAEPCLVFVVKNHRTGAIDNAFVVVNPTLEEMEEGKADLLDFLHNLPEPRSDKEWMEQIMAALRSTGSSREDNGLPRAHASVFSASGGWCVVFWTHDIQGKRIDLFAAINPSLEELRQRGREAWKTVDAHRRALEIFKAPWDHVEILERAWVESQEGQGESGPLGEGVSVEVEDNVGMTLRSPKRAVALLPLTHSPSEMARIAADHGGGFLGRLVELVYQEMEVEP